MSADAIIIRLKSQRKKNIIKKYEFKKRCRLLYSFLWRSIGPEIKGSGVRFPLRWSCIKALNNLWNHTTSGHLAVMGTRWNEKLVLCDWLQLQKMTCNLPREMRLWKSEFHWDNSAKTDVLRRLSKMMNEKTESMSLHLLSSHGNALHPYSTQLHQFPVQTLDCCLLWNNNQCLK